MSCRGGGRRSSEIREKGFDLLEWAPRLYRAVIKIPGALDYIGPGDERVMGNKGNVLGRSGYCSLRH